LSTGIEAAFIPDEVHISKTINNQNEVLMQTSRYLGGRVRRNSSLLKQLINKQKEVQVMQNHLHHVGILSIAVALLLLCAIEMGTAQDFVVTHSGTEVFRVGNGKLGINMTTAPLYPLTFNNLAGDKIALTGGSTNHYGFGLQSNLLQIYSSTISSNIAFGYGSSSSFTEIMRVKGNGNVGIGTTNPIYKLEVNGNVGDPLIRAENTGAGDGVYGVGGANSLSAGVFGLCDFGVGVWARSSDANAIICDGRFYMSGGQFFASPTTTTWTTNKPATVKLKDGKQVKLFAEEAAEVYFNDYGEARLSNGRAHIELDSKFVQTVTVDQAHSMKVFVQLEGDCKGVYVANKSSSGFDVVELQDGNSNARLTYRVVCKRKYYEDERLASEEEDIQYNKRLLETVWPEVIAQQKIRTEKVKQMDERSRIERKSQSTNQ
jgi:hypothetical protein